MLAAAIAAAVIATPHKWGVWYVVLLLCLAFLFGVGGAWAWASSLLSRPRIAIEDPHVATRGLQRPFKVTPAHPYMGGTVTAAQAWTATGPEAYEKQTVHAYVRAVNRPRRGDEEADVYARLRYFDFEGHLLHDLHGRWAGTEQHSHSELTLHAQQIRIPAHQSDGRLLDVAMKHPEDDQLFAFNDENRFLSPKDLRAHPLGKGPITVDVSIRGRGVKSRARFELLQQDRQLIIRPH